MPGREATARIKINRLLETAGWRFFAEGDAPANIRLEPGVKIMSTDLDALSLCNGNLHYLWDLERGNPNIITSFPT
jgi:hypothetical protein